ncbi:DegT/DnrJ/EryC1/StrS family aminotransferase [Salicibibacter kimchii]|uniref:DegT/DnrJ/EryC1/StrS family aminotransferase n=1 Tax=Salicibibacter kimchii TaxID=2099786 RepID=A0A345BUD6_9BACI|nr:DegT/DnrJ/EryC1/StrS family aminotransferase [Salicibibacter kimchii]AXF54567.1 DegT/DnrJ/EryC1/StrS family aminotransferase [Salicibibacter kimchii]
MTDERRIPMVDLQKEFQRLKPKIMKEVEEVLGSGRYILGPKCFAFEQRLKAYVGTNHAVGVANGTDALYLALRALNIGPKDEVITTPFTFFASGETIAEVGAKPVFVDINADSYNIDPNKIEEAITPRTKAIIVVHLFGKGADMKEIMKIANKHQLRVIEDACQAIGTEEGGKRAGSIGDIGCFSFFPSKNLGAFGDAGMIVTNNDVLYEKVQELRNHGSKTKYHHRFIGINSRLDELQAAMLLVKLDYLDLFLYKRKKIAKRYTEKLSSYVKTPAEGKGRAHTYHQYCIELKERDHLAKLLDEQGISSEIYYPVPLHLQEAFQYLCYQKGDFPISEKVSKHILALPISPELSDSLQDKIIASVQRFVHGS